MQSETLTKAAENLAISQAALSKQIKILEATLGAELLIAKAKLPP